MLHGLNVLYPETELPTFPVKHVRLWDCGIHWGAVHVSPFRFDFTRMDDVVARARAAGSTNLLYVMSATPTWLSTAPKSMTQAPWLNPGSNYPPFSMEHWDDFVEAVAARYRGRIGSYQIWNEPQIKWFWYPRPYAAIAQMTQRARKIIGEIDPNAKIVSAPLVPGAANAAANMGRYLTAMKARGCPVDVWSAHIYTQPGQGPEDWRHLVEVWRRSLVTAGVPKRTRWVTETNVRMGAGPVPDDRVPQWMRAVDRIAGEEMLSKVYWYAYGHHSDTSLLGIPFYEGSRGMMELHRLMGE